MIPPSARDKSPVLVELLRSSCRPSPHHLHTASISAISRRSRSRRRLGICRDWSSSTRRWSPQPSRFPLSRPRRPRFCAATSTAIGKRCAPPCAPGRPAARPTLDCRSASPPAAWNTTARFSSACTSRRFITGIGPVNGPSSATLRFLTQAFLPAGGKVAAGLQPAAGRQECLPMRSRRQAGMPAFRSLPLRIHARAVHRPGPSRAGVHRRRRHLSGEPRASLHRPSTPARRLRSTRRSGIIRPRRTPRISTSGKSRSSPLRPKASSASPAATPARARSKARVRAAPITTPMRSPRTISSLRRRSSPSS